MSKLKMNTGLFSNKGRKRFLISIVPYFLIFSLFEYVGATIAGFNVSKRNETNMQPQQLFIITFFGMLGSVAAVWALRRFLDKKPFGAIGFTSIMMIRDVVLGLLFGLTIMLAGFLILESSGQITVQKLPVNICGILLSIGTFSFVAITEEIYFRGYVLNNLMESHGKFVALLISSVFFALAHSLNPHFSVWGFINIIIAGILLGLSYTFTKSLWFPIALHFSWNFFQSLFGFNVSGMDAYSLYQLTYNPANIWNGGSFGFESSVLALLLQAVAVGLVYFNYKPEDKFRPSIS